MLTCKDSSKLISKSLDQPLVFKERIKLRMHLLFCSACRQFERQMNLIHRIARDFLNRRNQDEIMPMPVETRERIRNNLGFHADAKPDRRSCKQSQQLALDHCKLHG